MLPDGRQPEAAQGSVKPRSGTKGKDELRAAKPPQTFLESFSTVHEALDSDFAGLLTLNSTSNASKFMGFTTDAENALVAADEEKSIRGTLHRWLGGGTNWRPRRIIWQGVDHVLRSMRDPAHPGWAILHEVWEGHTGGRSGGRFRGRARYGTGRRTWGSSLRRGCWV